MIASILVDESLWVASRVLYVALMGVSLVYGFAAYVNRKDQTP